MRSGGRWRRSQNRCSCSHRRTSRSPPKSASAFRRTGCSGPETHRDHEGHGPDRQGRRPLTYVIDVLNLFLFVLVIRVVLSYIPAPPAWVAWEWSQRVATRSASTGDNARRTQGGHSARSGPESVQSQTKTEAQRSE